MFQEEVGGSDHGTAEPVSHVVPPADEKTVCTIAADPMFLRGHSSSSLCWKWHMQDFVLSDLMHNNQGHAAAHFSPRFALAHRIVHFALRRRTFPVTTVSSVRMAFTSSIVAAGIALKKTNKDGEVVARSISIKCRLPLLYQHDSRIPVFVAIDIGHENDVYSVVRAKFTIGSRCEHSGETTLLYCKPGTRGFSYIE
jgi:hypothetical protein